MIAFGCAVTKPEVYLRNAEVGIRLAAEPDSQINALASQGSIFHNYNLLMDWAAELDGLEALVLVHQDSELVEADFGARIRAALEDPAVGAVGCVGAIGVRSIAWWEGSVAQASFVHRFEEHGGGDLPAFSWDWSQAPPYARVGDVETLDGFVLAISPWAVRNIRFDEELGQFHGYDFDFCLQLRSAGRKVVTADFRAIHNHSLVPFDDPEPWILAHMAIAEKWEGRLPGVGYAAGSWQERSWRAQAARDATRITDYANALEAQAQIAESQRAITEMRDSISWRITAPLRMLSRRARQRRDATPASPPIS